MPHSSIAEILGESIGAGLDLITGDKKPSPGGWLIIALIILLIIIAIIVFK